jgi:hypothetical protein
MYGFDDSSFDVVVIGGINLIAASQNRSYASGGVTFSCCSSVCEVGVVESGL